MTGFWDNEERAREWPIESLRPLAAAVVEQVERDGGNGHACYCSMYELADRLGMWDVSARRGPGQVWGEVDLRETRERFASLLDPVRRAVAYVPEHPVWITMQLVDLLDPAPGLPTLSAPEIERRTQYLRLQGTADRLIRTQFDLSIAPCGHDEREDARRPETADEGVIELMDEEHVRPRTFAEMADDLREEAVRAELPERAAEQIRAAASLAQQGEADAASEVLERVVELLYDQAAGLGDFRTLLGG